MQVFCVGDRLAQVFGVGDRLKIDKDKAWNNNSLVAPKSAGSMTAKSQMKPSFRVRLTASQDGENSQSNFPEHTSVSSILTDLIFRRNRGIISAFLTLSLNRRGGRICQVEQFVSKFEIVKHSNINF